VIIQVCASGCLKRESIRSPRKLRPIRQLWRTMPGRGWAASDSPEVVQGILARASVPALFPDC